MTRRFKSSIPPIATFPARLSPAVQKRILKGESWLTVWRTQLAITLAGLSRKSGISSERLLEIEREHEMPDADELAAIARGLGTTVEEIEAIQD